MKKTLITAALSSAALLSSTFTHAVDMGIGVSLQATTAEIRFPIRFNRFMMEPFLYHEIEHTSSSNTTNTDHIAGSGFYYLNSIHNNLLMQVGLRVGAGQYEEKENSTVVYTRTLTLFNPSIGFEYFFDDHVSIGADAGFVYVKLEGGDTFSSTDTNLIARFYF